MPAGFASAAGTGAVADEDAADGAALAPAAAVVAGFAAVALPLAAAALFAAPGCAYAVGALRTSAVQTRPAPNAKVSA